MPARRPRNRRYPFSDMEIGDSIWVERAIAESAKVCAYIHAKRTGKRFAVREEGEGRRIWRTA